MKKVKPRKPLHDHKHKIPHQFVDDLYFNPKRRKEFRQSFIKFVDSCRKLLAEPQSLNPSKDEIFNRQYAEEYVESGSKMIKLIDHIVPRKLKEWQLSNCYFKLYQKQNSNYLAIEYQYDKGVPKKHHISYLLIPLGFPKQGLRTSVKTLRRNYNLKGFDQIDEGTFIQIKNSFRRVEQVFTGKNKTIKIELTLRSKVEDNNWLQVK